MDRLDRYGLTGRLNPDDEEAEDRDVEAGTRLLLLRGYCPPRVEPYVDFEFVLRSGEVLHLQHELRSVPRQMWAVVEVGALGSGSGTFFFDYRLVHGVPDVGPLRVGDYHPSLAKSVCSDSVCRFLLTALDISGEHLLDSDAAMSFLQRAHRHGLPPGVIPSPWVNEDGDYPKRGFAERLLAGMAPSPQGVRHGTDRAEPRRRLIKTFADAEQYASEYMRYLGFPDAIPTPPGADGGVDVVSAEAIAQVKMEGIATGRPVVQAIAGVASLEGKKALVFSLAGYTAQALEWADLAGIACLEFGVDGSIEPAN
ncbi:restriction endonuclease [Nocardioides eburneiflavus]|uniref:Restriction endonuclease n=2 Tax=Nocardioides eburneiflavus TaxID=2518372 RepID=A0A4Z1CPL2_9ACTN|nr:restriction endonuclease [Nocardioides eburneiflavus]